MAEFSLRLNRRPNVAQSGLFEFSFARDNAAINEGGDCSWTLTLDKNAGADAICSIEFFGSTTPALSGTYAITFFAAIAAMIAATPGFSVDPTSQRRVIIDTAVWNLTAQLILPTVNKPEVQGNVVAGVYAAGASIGSIIAGHVSDVQSITITDLGDVAPPAGDLSYVSFDVGPFTYVAAPSLTGVSVAAGTQVAEVLGFDADDDPVLLTSVALTDTLGNRFAIRQTGVGALARFFIDIGASPPTFETGTAPVIPIISYGPTVQASDGTDTAQGQLTVHPSYPVATAIGGAGGTDTPCADADDFYDAVNAEVDNRIIRLTASGITRPPGGNLSQVQLVSRSSRITIRGPSNGALRHNRAIRINEGQDVLIEGLLLGAGNVLAGTPAAPGPSVQREIDDILIGQSASEPIRDVIVRRCTLFASTDEILTITTSGSQAFAPRSIRITENLIADPFYNAGHTKGKPHNHGYVAGNYSAGILFDHNILAGTDMRQPLVKKAFGVLAANNLNVYWRVHPTYSGMRCLGSDKGLAEAFAMSASFMGNLCVAPPDSVSPAWLGRRSALSYFLCEAAITHLHCPLTGPWQNYFCVPSTDTFANDPFALDDGLYIALSSAISPNKDYPGFEISGFTPDETDTEAKRRALYQYLIANCGHPCQYTTDIKALIAAGTVRIDTNEGWVEGAASTFDALYGEDWGGVGGSLGHGIV